MSLGNNMVCQRSSGENPPAGATCSLQDGALHGLALEERCPEACPVHVADGQGGHGRWGTM